MVVPIVTMAKMKVNAKLFATMLNLVVQDRELMIQASSFVLIRSTCAMVKEIVRKVTMKKVVLFLENAKKIQIVRNYVSRRTIRRMHVAAFVVII